MDGDLVVKQIQLGGGDVETVRSFTTLEVSFVFIFSLFMVTFIYLLVVKPATGHIFMLFFIYAPELKFLVKMMRFRSSK